MEKVMSLEELKILVEKLASKIDAPKKHLPDFGGFPRGDAHPLVEVDFHGNFHYIISERGNEYRRDVTPFLQEILYIIFYHITSSMATEFELKNRVENQDFRRVLFSKKQELLAKIDPEFERKIIKKHLEILNQYPFNDSPKF